MNYYAIPDFLAVGMIVLVSFALRRLNRQTRFRYWALGWQVLLVHTILHVVTIQNGRWQLYQDTASMVAISLSSVIFLGAAGSLNFAKMRWMVLAAVPNFAYIVCWNFNVLSHAVYFALTGAGFVGALWFMIRGRFNADGSIVVSRFFVAAAYSVQLLLLAFAPMDFAGQWLLCWPFLLVAYLFWRDAVETTTGVIVTAVSFLLWACVFPVAQYLANYYPAVHVESEVWNIPKFLAASGMLLTLVEEQMTRMTKLAMRDELTGLANRRSYINEFEVALERSRRTGSNIALLVIDLNHFKAVNDTLGHKGGDELLCEVSKRFLSRLQDADMLARVGGDEFAVIMEGTMTRGVVENIIEMLHESLENPVWVRGHARVVTASIGAAFYPDDGDTHDSLYALADLNMYHVKEANREALRLS
ncbi:GGDEF domain-containing protein [Granulicella arctica]|uniref:GGDEF domain-containing protein n=1 Tax=Granulicella arctica TaxID=940613 RepID=UPI0021E0A227|nr:GGDEF domain-containing protein [Granulicella arctica]